MSSVDWNKIMSANKHTIEKDADTFSEIIESLEPNEISDVKQLRQLFIIARILMIIKDCQLDEAIKITMQSAKNEAKREIINWKHKELHEHEPHIRKVKSVSLIQGNEYYVESQLSKLNQENFQLERELKLQREIAEKYSNEITHLCRTKEAIRQEKNIMRVELNDYKSQVHLQWEHLLQKMSEDLKECKENLNYKDKLLKIATVEIESLNSIIQRQETLKHHHSSEMKNTQIKLNSINECNVKLERMLHEEDVNNKELKRENNLLKDETSKVKKREKSRSATDNAIMDLIDEKVVEWMKFIESLKREIDHYKTQIEILKQKLENEKENFKPASLVTLSKIISEKDQIIESLLEQKEPHSEKSQHLNIKKSYLEKSYLEKSDLEKSDEPTKELRNCWRQQILDAEKSREEAERHAFEKDKELYEVQKQLKKYEKQYGIEEARIEIEILEKKLQVNDRKTENLIRILNRENSPTDYDNTSEENVKIESLRGFTHTKT